MNVCKQIYGLYDLNDFVQCVGTVKEIAHFLGISEHGVLLKLYQKNPKKYVLKKLFVESEIEND